MLKTLLAFSIIIALIFGGGSYYKARQAEKLAKEAAEKLAKDEAAKMIEEERKQKEAREELTRRKTDVEQKAINHIKASLKDPDSLQLRNTSVSLDVPISEIHAASVTGPTDFVCGEFHAKNSFGGYTAYKPFYWTSLDSKLTINEMSDPNELMGRILDEVIVKTCNKIRAAYQ